MKSSEHVAAARAKRIANQKRTPVESIASTQPVQPTSVTSISSVALTQQLAANTLVVANGLNAQLTAIPLSGGSANNIVVNSATFARRTAQSAQQPQTSLSVQTASGKLQSKGSSASLSVRSVTGNVPQLQIHPQQQGPSMSLSFASQSPIVTLTTAVAGVTTTNTRPTITYPRGGTGQLQKLAAMQVRHASKQQQQQPLQTPVKQQQQVKQVRVSQSQHQLTGTMVSSGNTGGKTVLGGKTVQLAKPRQVTAQELELLMKQQRTQVKTIQHRPTSQQVHIAPIQAQVQAQQVRNLAAQQATQQQVTSTKPMPITVPVSNLVSTVNLSGLNVSSTSQHKPMIVAANPASIGHSQQQQQQQLILQQHLLKQRQTIHSQSQQQQTRQVMTPKQQKAVYATVGSQQLVSGGGSAVKMTPQIQAQMINQLVAHQHHRQRRSAATSKGGAATPLQPPVTLTVTKLLQTSGAAAASLPARHTLVSQVAQLGAGQISANSTAVVSATSTANQQRIHQQRPLQLPRVRQIHQMSANQPQTQQTAQMVVATQPVTMQRSMSVASSKAKTFHAPSSSTINFQPAAAAIIQSNQVSLGNLTRVSLATSTITQATGELDDSGRSTEQVQYALHPSSR